MAAKKVNRRKGQENRIQVSDLSEESLTDIRARRPKKQKTKKGTRRPRRSEFQKLKDDCQETEYAIGPEGSQVLAVLEDYCKRHFSSMEPWVLRELLRVAHKSLPKGAPKSKIRGILGYFTRSNSTKNWMKIAMVLRAVASQEKVKTFVQPKEIPFDRVVDESEILSMSGNPRYTERIEVMDAKIQRLKTMGSVSRLGALIGEDETSLAINSDQAAGSGPNRLAARPSNKRNRVKMLARTAAKKRGYNTMPPTSGSDMSGSDNDPKNGMSLLNRNI